MKRLGPRAGHLLDTRARADEAEVTFRCRSDGATARLVVEMSGI